MKYEFLEHTADVKFRAYGKTLEEAFINAALATAKAMTEDTIQPKIEKQIEVEAKKKESLLYEFLEELLFLVDTEAFILSEVKELSIKDEDEKFILTATLLGDEADKYDISTHIKAVTYSEMLIEEKEDNVTIQVVHDI